MAAPWVGGAVASLADRVIAHVPAWVKAPVRSARRRRLVNNDELSVRMQTAWLVAAQLETEPGYGAATDVPLTGGPCTQRRCQGPEYARWTEMMGLKPKMNRKTWEFTWICRVLDQEGLLAKGRTGVGFGTGGEPIPALLASRGVKVLATDYPGGPDAHLWKHQGNPPDGSGLERPDICPPAQFQKHVQWRAVDMRRIPQDLGTFDFCWSACAFEHLGSLGNGLDFVEASLRHVRPGGLAVHTTEYNLQSNARTWKRGLTVLYRQKDIEAFVGRMDRLGHEVLPIDWDPGMGVLDRYVDEHPFTERAHLRLRKKGVTFTSFGIAIRKAR